MNGTRKESARVAAPGSRRSIDPGAVSLVAARWPARAARSLATPRPIRTPVPHGDGAAPVRGPSYQEPS